MERIRQLSREIGDELRTKEKTLRWAANEYTRQEQESFLKAKQLKLPVTLNKFAALPTTSGNKTTVLPSPFSAFSLFSRDVWRTLFGTLSGLLTVQMHDQTYSEPLKMAQLRLQELGFEVEANGYFDEATLRALEGFREVYEKDQDGLEGVIGPVTWQALFNIPKVEPVEKAKSEPQYYITSVDPRSYSLDDVLNRDDPEVQERLKQTYWADLTKEEQDRIYN
ncbi:hypothetical protein BK140_36150, partial [Paenibacillus macerans]